MMSRPHVAPFWLQVVSVALNMIATWMLMLRVYSSRDLSDYVVMTLLCLVNTSLASFHITTSILGHDMAL